MREHLQAQQQATTPSPQEASRRNIIHSIPLDEVQAPARPSYKHRAHRRHQPVDTDKYTKGRLRDGLFGDALFDDEPYSDGLLIQSIPLERLVKRVRFSPRSSPRSCWWSTPSGTMPNWLLWSCWFGLGIPAIVLAIQTLTAVFLPAAATGGASGSAIVGRILIATIVNLSALVLFAILGNQTVRKLRYRQRRRQRD